MPRSSQPSGEATPQRCCSEIGSYRDWAAPTRGSDECLWPPALLMSHDVHPVDIQFDSSRRRIALLAGIIDACRQAGEIGDRHGRQSMHTPGSANVTPYLDVQTHRIGPLVSA